MARALPPDRLKANITPVATFAHHRASFSLSLSLFLSPLSLDQAPHSLFTIHHLVLGPSFDQFSSPSFDSLVTGVELTILDYSYRMAQQ